MATLLLVVCCLLVSACSFPGSIKRTVKLGLSAPFEGLHRDLGYEALNAVRLAVRQRNGAGGVGGNYLVELVALNDFNETQEALVQARKMAVDPGVLGVLGGWTPETAHVMALECHRSGLACVAPDVDWTLGSPSLTEPADPLFAADYKALSGGAPPGPAAIWAYAEANHLLDAFDAVVVAHGHPSRKRVTALLVTGD